MTNTTNDADQLLATFDEHRTSSSLGVNGCSTGSKGYQRRSIPINANPNTFPDITINTASAVPIVIQAQNIPPTAAIKLTILDENGVPDTVIQAPPLSNCDPNNVCTTTVNVVFPFGASRGLTKVTWTP